MVRMEYALAESDDHQPRKPQPQENTQQVSPEVSEVLHMLDALQTIKRKPGSEN